MAHIAIIGSGIAGLFAASQLADAGHDVTVVTKKRPKDSSTNWAQGGVAAILDKTNVEGMESHVQDTLRSGDGACDEAVVRSIISEAGDRIMDLIRIGVEFEKEEDGAYSFIREGGHSSKRILHAKDVARLPDFETEKPRLVLARRAHSSCPKTRLLRRSIACIPSAENPAKRANSKACATVPLGSR